MKNRDFRISDNSRQKMIFFSPVFETKENLRRMYIQAQELSHTYNTKHQEKVSAAKLHSCAVLHLIYQTVISAYLKETDSDPFSRISVLAGKSEDCMKVLDYYGRMFPTELDDEVSEALSTEETVRAFFVHQVYQANPAILKASQELLNQNGMSFPGGTKALKALLGSYLQGTGLTDSADEDLFSFLTRPARLFPESLEEQILYILKNWAAFLPDELRTALLRSLDYLKEENKPQNTGGSGFFTVPDYRNESDVESFSEDKSWMPNVVMMAKSTLVWLDQLSKKYRREVARLDQIPDEELDTLKNRGFTALWLIGLWQRSPASKKIKNLCGNPDAESSAYSLKGYDIADRLGGWSALNNLRARCWKRGIRLASDMVPNHTGIDSNLLYAHPEYFIQQDWPPFPSYSYTGENLSDNPDIEIKIEDHYFSRTDAAVTFMKYDRRTGQTSYIFHGNDGTTMPWNDTAQIDFLNPAAREAVIQQILEVARNFPIIRFDAAMTLAKRHIQRLWYPQPGSGGDIAGRTPYGMSDEEFNRRIPNEFWREVVDRIQSEVPDTLLLAEAFWMMESYFVRTLGMHRVYNSAFMHMMKNQDNAKYRQSIKATLLFDPEILKRYVNFMNNPDEDTAIAQFGNSDKYFGVCTLLATMPGLPMFGHGQIEGFREKYGMEYQRAYWDEQADEGLVRAHERKIFPLLKMRRLFSGCRYFQLFDAEENGEVQESIFAYTNGDDTRMTLVLYNNRYEHAQGRIRSSVPKTIRTESGKETQTVTLAQSLRLSMSPRRFVIYRNFTDGLIYVAPSMKIIEDGYWVSLNGYETRVLTDIHEIEDIDGVYARLCEHLQGRGISNLDFEIKLMYLQPFWNAAEGMKNQKFLKNLKSLLTGKS
ncbi:MAG: alpha-amylase family glycosyl hydrolase [Sphaerochaetaceae bacterium]|nr:alpha-amylase family glycosyl hydrolase [Sphaerochaetaceae bacterium]